MHFLVQDFYWQFMELRSDNKENFYANSARFNTGQLIYNSKR